ncbi:ribonuclease Z [Halioxenophilus sp. WMMB6]|uniref:ribonuclease Z n=1 Tax=Halioxenophilus sp. WMMB6 TaxID=3073815 RepID=UPI00295EF973|nr:ribonuclease Z [Halioxenophilus sp. WMMB6]
MDILFLGTSSGTPTKERNVTAIALIEQQSKNWYLIDCGEGTQQQLLHTRLSLATLRGVFITHVHGDHCYGLPGLLASAGMQGRSDALPIVAPKGIAEWIAAVQQHTQLHLPYALEWQPVERLTALNLGTVQITTTPLSHRVPSYAYQFTEQQPRNRLDIEKLERDKITKGPLWGELQRGIDVKIDGRQVSAADYVTAALPRSIIVAGDNDQPQLLAEAAKSCQVLVHEATFSQPLALKIGAQFGHSSAQQVAIFAEQAKIANLLLTHISPRYQSNPNRRPALVEIEQEAKAHYHGRLFIAEDFSRYRLTTGGELIAVAQIR